MMQQKHTWLSGGYNDDTTLRKTDIDLSLTLWAGGSRGWVGRPKKCPKKGGSCENFVKERVGASH